MYNGCFRKKVRVILVRFVSLALVLIWSPQTRIFVTFYFLISVKEKNAAQIAKKLGALYGDKAFKETKCQSWFVELRSGDFLACQFSRIGRVSYILCFFQGTKRLIPMSNVNN